MRRVAALSRVIVPTTDLSASPWHMDAMASYPVGTGGQVLARGLEPRFSIGTLQLSIRCSSIHFLPSRSFPVSALGVSKVAAPDLG
jgi:hypothetical protein